MLCTAHVGCKPDVARLPRYTFQVRNQELVLRVCVGVWVCVRVCAWVCVCGLPTLCVFKCVRANCVDECVRGAVYFSGQKSRVGFACGCVGVCACVCVGVCGLPALCVFDCVRANCVDVCVRGAVYFSGQKSRLGFGTLFSPTTNLECCK